MVTGRLSRARSRWTAAAHRPRLHATCAPERVEEKCEAVFRPQPALTSGIDHVFDLGLVQSKINVIQPREMAVDATHLIYFADPMCSWCWGFAPTIAAVRERYDGLLPIRLIMGGLRPGTDTPMTEAAKQAVRPHWGHVAEASGQPFDYGFFDRDGFVYDTDPAARAVVIVRSLRPALALDFLERVQRAFYAENQDVTDPQVLAELAAGFGLDRADFLSLHAGPVAKEEAWRDYAISQRAGVTGFPTLIGGPDETGVFGVVTRGFQPTEVVVGVIDQWLARAAAPN
jgi:putative protein-disulfide isomerase